MYGVGVMNLEQYGWVQNELPSADTSEENGGAIKQYLQGCICMVHHTMMG